ncbi:hypothetical protein SGLAM104S_09437 [Streptomyces glaucescens]
MRRWVRRLAGGGGADGRPQPVDDRVEPVQVAVAHVLEPLGRHAPLGVPGWRGRGLCPHEGQQHLLTGRVLGRQRGDRLAHQMESRGPGPLRIPFVTDHLGEFRQGRTGVEGDVRRGHASACLLPCPQQQRRRLEDSVPVPDRHAPEAQRAAHGVHDLVRRDDRGRLLREVPAQRLRNGLGAHRVHDPEQEGARVAVPVPLRVGHVPVPREVVAGDEVDHVEHIAAAARARVTRTARLFDGEPLAVVVQEPGHLGVGATVEHGFGWRVQEGRPFIGCGHRLPDGSTKLRVQLAHRSPRSPRPDSPTVASRYARRPGGAGTRG